MPQRISDTAAALLHQTCVNFQRRSALEAEGFVAPLGAGYTSEKEADSFAVQAWQATAKLLGLHDFREAEKTIGGHQAAIDAHQDREQMDRDAMLVAQDDEVDEWAR